MDWTGLSASTGTYSSLRINVSTSLERVAGQLTRESHEKGFPFGLIKSFELCVDLLDPCFPLFADDGVAIALDPVVVDEELDEKVLVGVRGGVGRRVVEFEVFERGGGNEGEFAGKDVATPCAGERVGEGVEGRELVLLDRRGRRGGPLRRIRRILGEL